MRIFFGGPLTDLTDKEKTKAFYRQLAVVARDNGFDSYWAFLNGTDPELNPDVSPPEVFAKDLEELAKSDLMVAYLGEPSTGTGQEIEFARTKNIPVYLLYERTVRMTRMVLGSPNVKGSIVFSDEADALRQFQQFLRTLKQA